MVPTEEQNEKISVIVPIYNVEKYLQRCIESIVYQSYSNLEIILVDDGSVDSCPEICDRYKICDSRIKVIHKENGGLSSARNAGISVATGKYISFVDSDDWIHVDAMKYLLELLKKYNADFSMAENARVHNRNEMVSNNAYEETVFTKEDFIKKILKYGTQENVQYAWAKLYKKELFSNIKYPVGLTSEDIPVTFEITCISKKIAYSSKIIYFYYYNPQSITGAKLSETVFDLIKIWEIVYEVALGNKCENWIINQIDLCQKRNALGILCNIALADLNKTEMNEWEEKEKVKSLSEQLKTNKDELLKSNIPLSRKILVILFSRNFKFYSRLIRGIYRKICITC